MHDTRPTSKNHILNSFSDETMSRLSHDFEHVDMPSGRILYASYEEITHIYFPENSMASIVANTSAGQSTEIGVVGREGAVGLEALMGVATTPHESMIQIPNGGWRIRVAPLATEFNDNAAVRATLLLFQYKFTAQVSQTALCNRVHAVEHRLTRWLLLCHDRVDGDNLRLTQEFLAVMLGVTRVSVTLAAQILQDQGLIRYARGSITIVDRASLEAASCDCYGIVKREYDRTS